MLTLVLRRMFGNRWIVACLFLGTIVAIAMISSVPIYTAGILQRMLTKDLESYQTEEGRYPGDYLLRATFDVSPQHPENLDAFEEIDRYFRRQVPENVGLPVRAGSTNLEVHYLKARSLRPDRDRRDAGNVRLVAIPGVDDRIAVTDGRMYATEPVSGVYEVMVTERALEELGLRIGERLAISDLSTGAQDFMEVRVVGTWEPADFADQFWFRELWTYRNSFLLPYALFERDFVESDAPLLSKVQWYRAFDYYEISTDEAQRLVSAYLQHRRWMSSYDLFWEISAPAVQTLTQYTVRERRLRIILWVIQAPVMLMLAFYVFMVANILMDSRKNEIAVVKSRGWTTLRVFVSYVLESVILSLAAVLIGPVLGLLLCSVLGASNGFLEFVNRSALALSLDWTAYAYSLLAALVLVATMLIPAYFASRTSIVLYKQQRSRPGRRPLWQRAWLDIAFIAVSVYGLYAYGIRREALAAGGVAGSDVAIDPLLFVISTLFVLGAGLFYLRLFPLLIRGVFLLGRKRWPPILYASFIQIERSSAGKNFLMLFLIMSLAIGLFSAAAARSVNGTMEQRIRYEVGADLTVRGLWERDPSGAVDDSLPPGDLGLEGGASDATTGAATPDSGAAGHSSGTVARAPGPPRFREPPFLPYTQLEHVEHAAKVFRKTGVRCTLTDGSDIRGDVLLMGIVSDDFGRTAWFRASLLPHHWWRYLNVLAEHPRAVLLSSTFRDAGVKLGDPVRFSWRSGQVVEATAAAFVDYWPTFNPAKETAGRGSYLIVANLPWLQGMTAVEPYDVWLKRRPGTTSEEIYREFDEKGIRLVEIVDAGQQVLRAKNDPLVQGLNGGLTLGFLTTLAMSAVGFLVYWIMNIQQRFLQFGIVRAMGITKGGIVRMILTEQLLVTAAAVIGGMLIGGLASRLFVPLLEVAYTAAEQIPPFQVIVAGRDYIRVSGWVLIVLASSMWALASIVSRLDVTAALKLGEE